MDKYKKISYQEYLNRDYRVSHAPLFPEMDFYNSIRMGDVKKVRKLCAEPLHLKKGLGELSEDKLRNMKYHFVSHAEWSRVSASKAACCSPSHTE